MPFLKLLASFFTILLFLSCSSSADKTTHSDSLATTTIAPTNNIATKPSERQSLEGKIFFFAPELDQTTCQATGACDCCSYNILFITDSTFVLIDYCETGYSYNKGSYMLDNTSLTLKVDKLMVDKTYNWESEGNTTGSETAAYSYKIEYIEPKTTILKQQVCNGTLIFKSEYDVGTEDNKRSFSEELKGLKNEGILAKLKL